MTGRAVVGLMTCVWMVVASGAHAQTPSTPPASKNAEPGVAARNAAVLRDLPFADRQDFDDARRGFVATTPDVAAPDRYAFLESDAPPTVNPSLWRLAQLNAVHGLFKVVDGLYQVRGYSLANMTIVEGQTGVIVIDPLSTMASAKAGMDLYFANRPKKPVVAVVYTHSHSDHYGGVKGVATEADVAAGRTEVFAPAGFMDAAVSESVIAGNAMGRRAQYQFGNPLPRGPRGAGPVDSRAHRLDPRAARDTDHRRGADHLPARARLRGAGGDAPLLPVDEGARHGRERNADAAQPAAAARHRSARRQRVVSLPQ